VRAYSVGANEFSQNNYFAFADYVASRDRHYPAFPEVWRQDINVEPHKVFSIFYWIYLFSLISKLQDKDGKGWLHRETDTAIDLSKAFGMDDSRVCGRSKASHLVVVVRADDTPEVPKDGPLIKKYWLTWTDIGIAYGADDTTIYGYEKKNTTILHWYSCLQ
jgi:hypothetical protein